MDNIKRNEWIEKVKTHRYLWYACIISFFILFLYAIVNKVDGYLGDAGNYYSLADTFYEDDGFRFTNFPDDIRGYAFPFLLFLIKGFGQFVFQKPSVGFLMINSMMLTAIFCILIPKLFCVPYHKKYLISTLITTLCFMYYWPDFITYPLSDMYAIFFFSISIVCFMKVEQALIQESGNKRRLVLPMLFLGASLYMCYNIRTVYHIPSIALMIFFLIRNGKRLFNIKVKSIGLIGIAFMGYFIMALPQMEINQKYNETYSPKVLTEKLSGEDLTLTQLYWGIIYTRYETNIESLIGSNVTYPSLGVRFVDKNGYRLLNEQTEKSYVNILKSYVQHPIAYFKLYVRHMINGIMPIYRETYITNMNANKWPAFILNYAILFICTMIGYVKRKELVSKSFYTLGLLLVAGIAVPGAIETRFMLPAFIVVYGLAFYLFDLHDVKQLLSNKKLCMVVVLLACFGFLFTYHVISTTLHSTEEHVQFTIGGG